MPETLTHTYTTEAEMARVLSQDGVDAFLDDNGDGAAETGVGQDCIDYATDRVNFFALRWYAADVMVNNLWVRRCATIIACHYLSTRRGNPGLYAAAETQVIADLTAVHDGRFEIPRLPYREDQTPALSNYVLDNRYAQRKVRVVPGISTGGTSGHQDLDPNANLNELP